MGTNVLGVMAGGGGSWYRCSRTTEYDGKTRVTLYPEAANDAGGSLRLSDGLALPL